MPVDLLPRPGRPLRTPRLVLTALGVEDLDAVHALHADPRTFEHDTTPPVTSRRAMTSVLDTWLADSAPQGFGYAAIRSRTEVSGLPGAEGPPVFEGSARRATTPGLSGHVGLAEHPALDGHLELARGAGRGGRHLPADEPPDPRPLLGVCGLTALDLDGEEVVSAYDRLRPEAWGRGIAREALGAVLAEADRHLAGRRAVVITDPGNLPSLRLARALGFSPAASPPPDRPHLMLLSRTLGASAAGVAPAPHTDPAPPEEPR